MRNTSATVARATKHEVWSPSSSRKEAAPELQLGQLKAGSGPLPSSLTAISQLQGTTTTTIMSASTSKM